MKILSKILTIISLLLVSSIAVAAQESKCPTATQGVYNLPAGQSLLYATETCFWDTFQGAKYKQKDNAVGFLKAMLSKATTPMTKSLINARIGWLHTWESTEFEVFASYNTKSSSLLNYEATKHFLVSYELNQGPISTSIGTQKLSALTISKGKKYGLPKCRWQRESCDNSSSPWDYVNPQLYNATVEGFVSGFLPLIPYNSFLKHQVPTGQVTASNNTAFFNISTPTLVAVNLNKLGKTNKDKTTAGSKAYYSKLKTYIDQVWTMVEMCSNLDNDDNLYFRLLSQVKTDPDSYFYTPKPSLWKLKEAYFPTEDIIKIICTDKDAKFDNKNIPHAFENNFMILGDLIFLYCQSFTTGAPSAGCKERDTENSIFTLYNVATKGANYNSWRNQKQIEMRMKALKQNKYLELYNLVTKPTAQNTTPATPYPHCMTCHQN